MSETNPNDVPGWEGITRRDGVTLRLTDEGYFEVVGGGHSPLAACPCCDKPFVTARGAKLAANGFHPLVAQ